MAEPVMAEPVPPRPLIVCEGLGKLYRLGGEDIWALRDVTVDIAEGEFVAVTGPSGSGKSTFLNLLGTLDRQTHGRMTVDGLDITSLEPGALARFRNRYLGFVFQHFHLLPRTTAWDNVELPLLYGPLPRAARGRRVRACLELVEMDHRAGHMPSELSGGQQQRVAIARALAAKPRILLADEPTGALDSRTAEEILGLFQILHESGITVVLITHDQGVAATAHRRLRFLDGRLLDDAA